MARSWSRALRLRKSLLFPISWTIHPRYLRCFLETVPGVVANLCIRFVSTTSPPTARCRNFAWPTTESGGKVRSTRRRSKPQLDLFWRLASTNPTMGNWSSTIIGTMTRWCGARGLLWVGMVGPQGRLMIRTTSWRQPRRDWWLTIKETGLKDSGGSMNVISFHLISFDTHL